MLCPKVGMRTREMAEKEADMNTILRTTLAAWLIVCVFPVWADHGNSRQVITGLDQDRYEYARVISAEPVIEIIRIPQDQRVCRNRPVSYRVAEHRSPGPAIFGAILGGVIGNQLSRGHGHGHHHGDHRTAATLAGATIGGVVATEIQYSKYPARYYVKNEQVCEISTSWRDEERVVAWEVDWKYQGQVYRSRMSEHPGDRIRVRVTVDPVDP